MSKPSLREALEVPSEDLIELARQDYIEKGKGDLETILEGLSLRVVLLPRPRAVR